MQNAFRIYLSSVSDLGGVRKSTLKYCVINVLRHQKL